MKSLDTMKARIEELTSANQQEVQELHRQREALTAEIKELEKSIPAAVEAGERDRYKALKARLSDAQFDQQYIKSRLSKLDNDPLIDEAEYNRLSAAVLKEHKEANAADKAAILAAIAGIKEIHDTWSRRLNAVNGYLDTWQRSIYRQTTGPVKIPGTNDVRFVKSLMDNDFGVGNFWRSLEEITPHDWKEES